MLTEERRMAIVRIVDSKKACTVQELTEILESSESTIRRDLTFLHNTGKVRKVHGGATSLTGSYSMEEAEVGVKYSLNADEKAQIAEYAASLIKPNECIYLDAGTTTEKMADYITETSSLYITNGINLAKKLSKKGFNVYIVSGKLKPSTEAVIGSEAAAAIDRYNFTKGFFGTNGICIRNGYTTPDIEEARVKTAAMNKCKEKFILADKSKFDKISAVTFADINDAQVITDRLENKKYLDYTIITEVIS